MVVKKSLTRTGYQFDDSPTGANVRFIALEDKDMRFTFKTLLLTSATLCTTAAFAVDHARVNVPFGFTAKGQSFPAGEYNVAMDANHNVVTLSSETDTSKQISWATGPAEATPTPALVKFDRIGSDYALRTIQLGEHVTPNLDRNNKNGVGATTSIGGQ